VTKLTIGMATFEDFYGVYQTVQDLHVHHDLREVEILVIDNHPTGSHGKEVRQYLENWIAHSPGVGAVRYVAAPEMTGTSQPRNRIFAEARSPYVLACDCHVNFPSKVIARLIQHYDENPDTRDLFSGPMVYDSGVGMETDFQPEWREQMWGTWHYDSRAGSPRWRVYEDLPTEEPFPIPGMGLGVFSCRKDAWLGFSPNFRQFGGEELYIHEKFRQAGARAMCLPWLYWFHRFGRPDGAKYPTDIYARVRNYVLGHLELGFDLDPVHEHFVASGKVPLDDWNHLLADPVAHEHPKNRTPRTVPAGPVNTLEELADEVRRTPRDLNEHVDFIQSYASRCKRVKAFVKRHEWNAILAAARPHTLIVHQLEDGPLLPRVHAAINAEINTKPRPPRHVDTYTTHVAGDLADSLKAPPEECDMLVLDTIMHAERVYAELKLHGPLCKRFILIRGAKTFGDKAEGVPGPGLMHGIRRFVQEHPEWSMIDFKINQYGMCVLGCQDTDKPKLPSIWTKGMNLLKSMIRHYGTGGGQVSEDVLQNRLAHCDICPARVNGDCAACGCVLTAKAELPTSFCPAGKWGPVPK
jgi:hypothetical protein